MVKIHFGKFNKPVHRRCRRCGRRAYHITRRECGACGYGVMKGVKSTYSTKR